MSTWKRFSNTKNSHIACAKRLEKTRIQPGPGEKRTTAMFVLANQGTETGSVIAVPLEKVFGLSPGMSQAEVAIPWHVPG